MRMKRLSSKDEGDGKNADSYKPGELPTIPVFVSHLPHLIESRSRSLMPQRTEMNRDQETQSRIQTFYFLPTVTCYINLPFKIQGVKAFVTRNKSILDKNTLKKRNVASGLHKYIKFC